MKTNELSTLRREIGTLRVGRGRRYPAALRERIEKAIDESGEAGWSRVRLASALGMPAETLAKWRAEARTRPSSTLLVPVEVVNATCAAKPVCRQYTLTSPSGYQVDGLGHADVLALLRELG